MKNQGEEVIVPSKNFCNSEPVLVSDIHFNKRNIIKSLGVPEDGADAYLLQAIADIAGHCLEICRPKVSLTVFSDPFFIKDTGKLHLGPTVFSIHSIILNALSKSSEIAVFIGTCGNEVELYSKKMMDEGNLLEGYIADLVGSEIAEGIAAYIHKRIQQKKGEGHVSNRYSPGYCKWPVSDQHYLFELMKGNNCGVQLNASALMNPIKSVSGIIGIGEHVHSGNYTCSICKEEYCLYRDKK
jgi:hypothetical protein